MTRASFSQLTFLSGHWCLGAWHHNQTVPDGESLWAAPATTTPRCGSRGKGQRSKTKGREYLPGRRTRSLAIQHWKVRDLRSYCSASVRVPPARRVWQLEPATIKGLVYKCLATGLIYYSPALELSTTYHPLYTRCTHSVGCFQPKVPWHRLARTKPYIPIKEPFCTTDKRKEGRRR